MFNYASTNLCYSAAYFGPRIPPFFGWQTRKLFVTNPERSLWLCTKHLVDMFSGFWIRTPSTFVKCSISHPVHGFYDHFVKVWKAMNSLTYALTSLVSFIYLSLISLQKGPLLSLFCQMSSIFIIILIIRIIKTTCLGNTILMLELEVKLPQSTWSLFAHNFPNSDYLHKIFGMLLTNGSVYFYTKKHIPPLLYFCIYNPSPNGKIVSLTSTQAHL